MNCVVCIKKGDFKCENNTNVLFCEEHFLLHLKNCESCSDFKCYSKVKDEVSRRLKLIKEVRISILMITHKMLSQIEELSIKALEKLDKTIQYYKNLQNNWKNPENKQKINQLFSTVLIKTQVTVPILQEVNFFFNDFVIEREKSSENLEVRATLNYLSETFGLEVEGHTKNIISLVFSEDSRLLFSGSTDKTIKVWETEKNHLKFTLKGHSGGVTSLALSSKTERLFSGSSDKTIKVWCTNSFSELRTLREHSNLVICLSLNPDENLLVSGSADSRVIIWEVEKYQIISILNGHQNWVLAVNFNRDGTILASGSKENLVKIWDMNSLQCTHSFTCNKDEIVSVLFTDQFFLSASKEGEIAVFSLENFSLLKIFTSFSREISSLALNKSFLIVCSVKGFFKILDLKDLKVASVHSCIKGKGRIRSVSSTNDGKFLAFGLESGAIVTIDNSSCDLNNSQSVSRSAKDMNQHSGEIKDILIFDDYQKVATFSSDTVLKVWRLFDKKLMSSCKEFKEVVELVREERELESFLKYFSC
jgi:WD40 repeat protein